MIKLVAVGTGDTPLIHAARQGHSATALYLLGCGAHPFTTSNELSATALHHSASTGCLELLHALLEKGVSVEAPSDAGPPLIWAAGSGKAEAVRALLQKGANPNVVSEDGVTPLFSAAAAGAAETVQILVENGADVNVRAGGATPLHVAADVGDESIVGCLLEHGADPEALDDDDLKAIHTAAARGHRAVVGQLLPVTSPDPKLRSWSVDDIMSHVESETAEAEKQEQDVAAKRKAHADASKREKAAGVSPEKVAEAAEAKARGTEAFKEKDFRAAIDAFTQAIDLDPNIPEYFANRSLCWIRLGQAEQALVDAKMARELRPEWAKACYREGVALRLLQRHEEAAAAFYDGVLLEPDNPELTQAFKEAVEAGTKFHGRA